MCDEVLLNLDVQHIFITLRCVITSKTRCPYTKTEPCDLRKTSFANPVDGSLYVYNEHGNRWEKPTLFYCFSNDYLYTILYCIPMVYNTNLITALHC